MFTSALFHRSIRWFGLTLLCSRLCFALDLTVPAGGDIQAAIDRVADAGGGVVRLGAGEFPLEDSLRIKSGVTLRGEGPEATILRGGDFPVIRQDSEGLRKVGISRLQVTGTQTKRCYGIVIEAGKDRHAEVVLSDLVVTGTGMGVHLKRVDGAKVLDCKINANGAPGQEGYYHNLYVRSCEGVAIERCELNGSTSGNGLNVSYSKDVTVASTTASDNHFRGMRAAETDGFTVADCVIERNGGTGLIANQEKGGVTRRLLWTGNKVVGNREGGIRVLRGATGELRDNIATDNAKFDYQLPEGLTLSGNR